jgi:hypothetical protein
MSPRGIRISKGGKEDFSDFMLGVKTLEYPVAYTNYNEEVI